MAARMIAQKLSEAWGSRSSSRTWPAAASNIGIGNAAKAPPDGYTVLFVLSSFTVNPSLYSKVPYDPLQGLHARSRWWRPRPHVLTVHPAVPVEER